MICKYNNLSSVSLLIKCVHQVYVPTNNLRAQISAGNAMPTYLNVGNELSSFELITWFNLATPGLYGWFFSQCKHSIVRNGTRPLPKVVNVYAACVRSSDVCRTSNRTIHSGSIVTVKIDVG